jgi:hypothetical protein
MIGLMMLASMRPAAVVSADERVKPPMDLHVLEAFVGDWDEVVIQKVTEPLPKVEQFSGVTRNRWALCGKLLRLEGTWHARNFDFLNLVTYEWTFVVTNPHGKAVLDLWATDTRRNQGAR